MYVHRVNNGKRVPMYVCGNYAKQPVGTLCQSAHRIKVDHVMEIVAKTVKEVIQYTSLDKGRFAEEIQSHIEDRQTVDFIEQRKRMNVCEKRIGELEMLIAKIYEDNALGNVSRQAVTKWEADTSRPTSDNLIKLAQLFEVEVDTLLGNGEREKSSIQEEVSVGKMPCVFIGISAEYDSIEKEQTKTATELAYAEVISYNKKNLERELQNESRQHSRQQNKTKRREEEI